MKKTHYAVCTLLIFCCIFSGCSQKNEDIPPSIHLLGEMLKPVPFGGYVCGFEDTKTLFQLPVFSSGKEMLPVNNISTVTLLGDQTELSCVVFKMGGFNYNEEYDYVLATLFFHVEMPQAGEYTVNQLQITLRDGKEFIYPLGDIHFFVEKQETTSMLSMSKFMINQTSATNFKIAFMNESTDVITIDSLSYLDSMYKGLTITKFVDFGTQILEDGLDIPANEERTFFFSFKPNNDFFSNDENKFLFMLPFVNYSVNGKDERTNAQTQSTIIQPSFTPEYVLNLFGVES